MAKRFSDTEVWEEDWFLEMPNEYKLFWFYMLSKCDHSGLFKVNLRSFRGLIDVSLTSADALKFFNYGKNRIRVINESLWLIEDFFVYQYGTTFNPNNRMHESIGNLWQKNKIELTSIRGLTDLKDRVKDKDKDKEIKKGVIGENKSVQPLKGIKIDIDQKIVHFSDGTTQELGPDQIDMLERKQLSPQSVIKNQIY